MSSKDPNIPILDFPSQSIVLDTVLTERTSNKLGNYAPLEPGAPFPKETHSAQQATAFASHEFLAQKATDNDEWIFRSFGKPPSTQDIANWDETFAGEGNAYPAFQRRYLEKRDSYAPRTRVQPLAGLYRINVTAAGSGYLVAPTISFTGGTGSGATAIAILNGSGGIAKITIKSEGTYTVVPTVVITAVSGGSGATAIASIQPSTCILTKEVVSNDAPAPYDSLYIVVSRLYETIPGPPMTSTRYDQESDALVTTTKTKKLLSAINEGVATTGTGVTAIVTITESDQIDNELGVETVTVMPQPAAHDEATAIISEECLPFQFPGTLDVDLWESTTGHLGTAPPFIKRVSHIKKVWWEISVTRPALALNGLIDFSQQQGLLGRAGELQGATPQLADGQTVYNAFDFDIYHFLGSTPDYDEYLANWVGGAPRSVLGSVRRDGGKYRWRVEKYFVQFIMLVPATLV